MPDSMVQVKQRWQVPNVVQITWVLNGDANVLPNDLRKWAAKEEAGGGFVVKLAAWKNAGVVDPSASL